MEGVAAAHGCKAEVQWSDQAYGPTVNSQKVVDLVQTAAEGLVGPKKFILLDEPSMAGEDFSFLAGKVLHTCSRCTAGWSSQLLQAL